jgi:hypothetical protein
MGLRGGYTLPQSFYIGGAFDYFFGTSDSTSAFGFTSEVKSHLWMLGGEFGYDLGLSPVIVVRPYLGIGYAAATAKVCITAPGEPSSCATGNGHDAFFELGGSFNYFNGRFFFGGDARFFHADDNAFVLGAHIGVMF